MKKELIKLGYMRPSLRKHLRPILDQLGVHKQAATNPLPPTFPDSEIALMTREEFLDFRNPEDKTHSQEAYDFDLFSMNRDRSWSLVNTLTKDGTTFSYYHQSGKGYLIKERDSGKLVGIVPKGSGTLFHEGRIKFPLVWSDRRGNIHDLQVERTKQVKYLTEVLPLVSDPVKINQEEYPHLLQRIKVAGEFMEVRSERPPEENEGVALGIFNSEGLKVAIAQKEWGATLFSVAKEYRGKGLGKIIGSLWYEQNPDLKSGGFTEGGQGNALAIWEDRVRSFSAKGWYSELVKEGRLTHSRVQEILAGLSGKKPSEPKDLPFGLDSYDPEDDKNEEGSELLIYSDMQSAVVLYDSKFLDDPDEKYIHGYAFLRDAKGVGSFIFRIDYDRSHAENTTYAVFQLARSMGNPLYIGEGYGDFLELEGLSSIEQDGDFAYLKNDVLPFQSMVRKEARIRGNRDPYGELKTLLLEGAEHKW